MESKLLAGTKNIMDKTDQQQLALEQQKQEMIEQKVYNILKSANNYNCGNQKRERAIQQQLLLKEESTLEVKENFSSLQEEVDGKTKKLNKVTLTADMLSSKHIANIVEVKAKSYQS